MRYQYDSLWEDSRSKSKSRPACLDGIIQWSQWCFWGNIFGGIPRTSPLALAQHHLRRCRCSLWPICLNANSDHISPHLLLFPFSFSLSPLFALVPSVFGVFWAAPRLRFVASFARSSCFQADFQCQRFGDNEVWTGIVSFTFFCLLFIFFGLLLFFRCVIVARVFRFCFFFFLFFETRIYTHDLCKYLDSFT